MSKKTKFLLSHPKIYDFYTVISATFYRIKRIWESGDCKICDYCKNKGCFKNRVAKKLKMAGFFDAKCFEPIKNQTTVK